MFNNMSSIDMNENMVKIFKILKIIIPIVILIIILMVFLMRPTTSSTNNSYTSLEEKLIKASKDYYHSDGYQDEEFITIYMLNDQKLINMDDYDKVNCDNNSGVLIENNNFTPYLICPAYKSKVVQDVVDKKEDKIKLKGDNPLIINVGNEYEDPGYESNQDVKVIGTVENKLGLYKINYTLNDGYSLQRLVIVTDLEEDEDVTIKDQSGLELKLKGEQNVTLIKGMNYADMGATAYDNVDGNITKKIENYGTVNVNTIGTYTLTYTIRNSRGYRLSATRTVTVEPPETEALNIITNTYPQTPTNQKVKISVDISGDDYSYTVLPNNSKTFSKNITYEVSAKGTYTFKVYPQYGDYYEQKVTVNNIDKDVPIGSCYAVSTLSKTDINVVADNKQNLTYSYSIGSDYTSYVSNNNYTFNSKATTANVKIKDTAGNVKTIACKLDAPKFDSDKPIVYIYNTHQYENYKDTKKPSGVFKAGKHMRDLLIEAGVPTVFEEGDITTAIWERTTPSKYAVSKKFIKAAQKKYPSLVFFIDLHRDTAAKTTVINGKRCVIYFFLIGGANPDYKKNLAVAKAIDKTITSKYPNLARDIMIRGSLSPNSRQLLFNQTMGTNFVLIELGGENNTYEEAKNTVDLITPFIADYVKSKFIK